MGRISRIKIRQAARLCLPRSVGRGPATDAANDWPKDTSSPKFLATLIPGLLMGNTFKVIS